MRRPSSDLIPAFFIFFIISAGCGTISQRRAVQDCKFDLDGIAIKKLGAKNASFELSLGIKNPNEEQVILDRFELDIYSDEIKIASASRKKHSVIPPKKRSVVKIMLHIPPANLGRGFLRMIMKLGKVKYSIKGTVHIKTWLGSIPYSIDMEKSYQSE